MERLKVKSLINVQSSHIETHRDMELQKQKAEKYLSKKSLITKKKDEAIRNIRDLGALPEEAFEKYQHMSMKQVF